jgi:predicted SprT family Zn-dependent metalloprotease
MSQSNEVDAALDNLQAIQRGEDPRSRSTPDENDALTVAREEVDRLFDEHASELSEISRDQIDVIVARWDGRNGVCKYNETVSKHRFGKRMTSQSKRRNHVVGVNEKIFEQGNRDGFIDTVRHELAHAAVYEEYGGGVSHGVPWQHKARALGADPSSTHHRRDRSDEYQYYIYCPECGASGGRTKRCKIIKQPFNRMCGKCEAHPMSSYEAGQDPPEEKGVVKVESLSWDNKDEWYEQGCP